eukprot:TRINITY_DN4892_c0_g1_i9.p1 TRINITY_DN4892_c0_g1~~TRINITY_DN4892_c0_g1_i9.p1  ORF type:complete len:252 (-),score=13.06 TRINITY_DN4892_c0_g1_i9:268-1023(-)
MRLLFVLALAWFSAQSVLGTAVGSPPLLLTVGTCAGNRDTAEYCLNFDCGSCGSSCCMLRFRVADDPERTMNLMKTSFDQGGPDGAYVWLPGHLGLTGFRDERSREKGVAFVGLLSHTTNQGEIQALNIAIVQEDGGGSRLDMASTSLASLQSTSNCDRGQNYKNILMAMKGVTWRSPFEIELLEPFCQLNGSQICVDTLGWKNPYRFSCEGYVFKGWCANGGAVPGMEWALGADFDYPETHCCACGKPAG